MIDELKNIKNGKISQSAIFHRSHDFSIYTPIGFYKASIATEHFFSCYQWLAKCFLELSDTMSDTTVGNGNEFRRAISLFQSLAKCKIISTDLQKPEAGLEIWKQINKTINDLNISNNKNIEQNTYLLPSHLTRALESARPSELSVSALSNPLNRARLLLTIRSNAPREFNSTSIFSLAKKDNAKEKQLKFHLLMPLYTPEQDVPLALPIFHHEDTINFNYTPIILLLLQNKHISWANKILIKNSSKLNEDFVSQLSQKQNLKNSDSSQLNLFWQIFANLSEPCPEQTQLFLQTENWRTFCLERQGAAWIDNFLASKLRSNSTNDSTESKNVSIDSATRSSSNNNQLNTNTTNTNTISSTVRKFGIAAWRTTSAFNYLEPCLDLYNKCPRVK